MFLWLRAYYSAIRVIFQRVPKLHRTKCFLLDIPKKHKGCQVFTFLSDDLSDGVGVTSLLYAGVLYSFGSF